MSLQLRRQIFRQISQSMVSASVDSHFYSQISYATRHVLQTTGNERFAFSLRLNPTTHRNQWHGQIQLENDKYVKVHEKEVEADCKK